MKKMLIIIACALCVGLTVSNAAADTIINLVLPTFYGEVDNYVGVITKPEPANLTDEIGYISTLITVGIGASSTIGTRTYDRILSDLTPLPAVPSEGVRGADGVNTFTAIFTGEAYVLGKYDGPNVGAGSVVWLVEFNKGDQIVLPTDGAYAKGQYAKQYGLSHYSYFTTEIVPEPGILILLGIAMSAIGAASWKMRKL